jgi:hypothetical protein
MPISTQLYDVLLTHTCPHCGNKTQKPGSYLWRMRCYHCPRCEKPVALSYEEKLKLFHAHARLTE